MSTQTSIDPVQQYKNHRRCGRYQRTARALAAVWVCALGLASAQAMAQTLLPPLPGPASGRLSLDLRANAYYDNQYYYDISDGSRALAGNLHAQTVTGLAGQYSSTQQAWAQGYVSPTEVKLYSRTAVSADTAGTNYAAFATGTAQAQVQTPFIVSGGAAPGSSGTLVATLLVSGAVAVDPGYFNPINFAEARGQGYMYFWATGLNATGCTFYVDAGCLDIRRDYTGDQINSNNALRPWTVHIPFSFDNLSSFSMQMWTLADSYANAPLGGGSAQHASLSDFAHTLAWGGIQAVLDSNGQPVSGWGISSLPGVDLTSAVPEPGSWALLLAGLAGLGWLQHRRRHQHQHQHLHQHQHQHQHQHPRRPASA